MSPRIREALPAIPDVLDGYLSEAAFSYARRAATLADPAATWDAAAAWERRMQRQLEGLRVSGLAAFEMFRGRLTAPDTDGEAFATAATCMALPLIEPKEALEHALAGPAPHRDELVDALRYAAAPDTNGWLTHLLSAPASAVRRAAIAACVCRPELHARIADRVYDVDPIVALDAFRTALAVGLRPAAAGAPDLDAHVESASAEARALALEAMARVDRGRAARACRARAAGGDVGTAAAAASLLAMCEDRDHDIGGHGRDTPAALARAVAAPGPGRDLCHLELAVRHSCPVTLDVRAPLAHQREAARLILAWAAVT